MASLVLDEIKHFTEDDFKTGLHILFSAHGVPESYILAGDKIISKQLNIFINNNFHNNICSLYI